MSRDATIELTFAGDVRTFKLAIENVLAIEDACACGITEIAARLSSQTWRTRDVTEAIRIGLVGAGVEGLIAKRLVEEHVVPGRLMEHALIAQAIVMAALVGDPREQVGKKKKRRRRENVSPLRPSMESQGQSVSP
jgi:hypothetical protein